MQVSLPSESPEKAAVSQPATHRRQAGEMPAQDHCLNMDALFADRFVAENNISVLLPLVTTCVAHITLWNVIQNMQIVHLERKFTME